MVRRGLSERDRLMTSGDVARRLALGPTAVHKLAVSGKLVVADRTVGGMRLFRESQVELLAEERRRNPPRRGRKPAPQGLKGAKQA